ncbi:MAG: hypothetical protein Q8L51_01500 [Candidatus Amesbacteria bacterium]|nr:hypothetical protein [Candidatus Amesbacteria bacterium]
MYTQSVFQAGNSNVVAIPPQFLSDLNLSTGQKVFVDKIDDETIVIKKASTKVSRRSSDQEFQKWLTSFVAENAEILDELAER